MAFPHFHKNANPIKFLNEVYGTCISGLITKLIFLQQGSPWLDFRLLGICRYIMMFLFGFRDKTFFNIRKTWKCGKVSILTMSLSNFFNGKDKEFFNRLIGCLNAWIDLMSSWRILIFSSFLIDAPLGILYLVNFFKW